MSLTKYQEVAKRILAFKDEDFKLDMYSYESDCGTAFCLAGWLAHLDGYPEEYLCEHLGFEYGLYSSDLIGHKVATLEWEFLFESLWPDDLDDAKRRARYILDNGTCPPEGEWPT